jgi:hypothetical protein
LFLFLDEFIFTIFYKNLIVYFDLKTSKKSVTTCSREMQKNALRVSGKVVWAVGRDKEAHLNWTSKSDGAALMTPGAGM